MDVSTSIPNEKNTTGKQFPLPQGEQPASKNSVAFWMSNAFDISLIPFSFCNPGRSAVIWDSHWDVDYAALKVLVHSLHPAFNRYNSFYSVWGKWEKPMSKPRPLPSWNYVLGREIATLKKRNHTVKMWFVLCRKRKNRAGLRRMRTAGGKAVGWGETPQQERR